MDAMVLTPATRKGLAWLAAASIVVTIVVAFQQYQRTAAKLDDPAGGHISDFDRWMIMTPRFVHDHADYVNDDLPTPPLSLLLFGPLSNLSRPGAAFVWVLFKLPLAIGVFLMAAAIVGRAGITLTPEALTLIVAGLVARRRRRHAGGADELPRARAAGGGAVGRAARDAGGRSRRGRA
jgi:hypothetical protein